MGDEGVPNIAGIMKVDDYTVEVTLNGFEAPAVYSVLGISSHHCTTMVTLKNMITKTTCSALILVTFPSSKA